VIALALSSPAATRRFGRLLPALLRPPALVTLAGELGTGKTTLVRAALRAFGVRGVVASPSFTLAQSYAGRGALKLHHLDLYRLHPGADVGLFAWEDYFDDAITFVEWPAAGAAELPPADLDIRLAHDTRVSRRAEVRAAPAIERRLRVAIAAAGIVIDTRR
jgi:tRNA threonylcarbamoyladenosine biosynthesis protein TsaE